MPITVGVGTAGTISSASGGKVYVYNNIAATASGPLVTVAQNNPARQTISFHNPGTADVFVAPLFTQNTGVDVAFAPTNAALGGSFRIFAGSDRIFTGECQRAWQAFADTGAGATNPLTVTESNV